MIPAADTLDIGARSVADLLSFVEQLDDCGDGCDVNLHALSMTLNDGSLTGFLGATVCCGPGAAAIRVRLPMSSKFRSKFTDGTPVGQVEIRYLNGAVVMRDGAVHLPASDRFSSDAIVKNVEFVHAPLIDNFTGIDHAIVAWATQYMRVDDLCERELRINREGVPGSRRLDYGRIRGLQLADPKETVRFIISRLESTRNDGSYTDLMRDEWNAWIGKKTLEGAVRKTLRTAGFRNIPHRGRHISA